MRQTYEETEALKQLILEKAKEVFLLKGYTDTKMQDIADAANISRGPLYYHYANKLELFNRVAELSLSKQLEVTKDILSRDISFFDMIKEDLLFCTNHSENQFNSLISGLIGTGNPDFDYVQKILEDNLSQRYDMKYSAAQRAKEKGEIRQDVNLERLINILYGCYNMLAMNERALDRFGFEQPNKYGVAPPEIILDFILNSLKREFT